MQAAHPAIEFLSRHPSFELLKGRSGWFVLDHRSGMTASSPGPGEPGFCEAIQLRFPGAPDPFLVPQKPFLELHVLEASRLLNLSKEKEDTLRRLAAAWRMAVERVA